MSQEIMSKQNLFFQTSFSKSTYNLLKRCLKVSDNDKILMTIWMGHIHNCPMRDRYFCFTKEGLYWNFPAIVRTGLEGENSERFICQSDFFQKEGSGFSLVFTKCDGDLNELHIKMGDRTFVFQFTKRFPKENIEELERIIRDYFTGYFDEKQYEEKEKKSSLRMALYNIPDFFRQMRFIIADGYLNFLDKTEKFFGNLGKKKSDNKTEKSAKTENTNQKQNFESNVQEQYENRFVRFIRHTFDLIADLIFVLAVTFLVKESIIVFDLSWLSRFLRLSKLVDIIKINGNTLLSENFLGYLILFVALKIFVILSCINVRKIVPILLLIILSFSCVLIKISFLIFLILSLLLLLTLQYSMNFKSKTIKIKAEIFIILTLALYISLHLFLALPGIDKNDTLYIDVFYSFLQELKFTAN